NSHTAAGSAIGVFGETLSGLVLSGTTHSNSGSYTDTWTFTDVTGNYNNASGTVTDSIAKADATVTANNKSKTYGDANPALDTAVSGKVNGDLLNYTLATSAGPFSSVGSYAITITLGANPNYNITATSGTLTVTPKAATITANNRTKIYGQTVIFTGTEFTTSGLVNNDTATSVNLTSPGAGATAT